MRTILIIDTDDADYNQFYAFKDDQDYHDALNILAPYEEILEKLQDCDEDDDWDELADKQDEMWTGVLRKLGDLATLHLEGVSEYNNFDYTVER